MEHCKGIKSFSIIVIGQNQLQTLFQALKSLCSFFMTVAKAKQRTQTNIKIQMKHDSSIVSKSSTGGVTFKMFKCQGYTVGFINIHKCLEKD